MNPPASAPTGSAASGKLRWRRRPTSHRIYAPPLMFGVGSKGDHPEPGKYDPTHVGATSPFRTKLLVAVSKAPGPKPFTSRVGMLSQRSMSPIELAKFSEYPW